MRSMAEEWTIEMKRTCGQCGGSGKFMDPASGVGETLVSSGPVRKCDLCRGTGSEAKHVTLAMLKKLLARGS